jgi:L,D-peptidoglycan transpeptidase YkuD (ErfK/YbiS/YcfS/YnhG family)
VDRNVRDTVELLRSQGLLDSTLLVFASDNGYALGEHRWQGKTLGYEPILKVPLLMRGPGVPAGTRVDQTVGLVDLGATFAEAAGARPMIEQDGVSLVEVARGKERGYEAMGIEAGPALPGVPPDEYTYRGVRTSRYTFMRHPVTGEMELYDRKVDPGQVVNVAYRPTHAATRRALERKLARLEDCAGEACHRVSGAVPEPEPERAPVHPDELAASVGVRQLLTVTAPRAGATRGTAVAWQRTGRQWRIARGPMEVGLGGRGMSTTRGNGRDAVLPGVEEPSFAFGHQGDPGGELPYRGIEETQQAPSHATPPSQTRPALDFLSSSTAVWGPGFGEELARDPERFERTVVLRPHRSPEELWSPRLSDWISGVPTSVDRGSLLMHTGERFPDRGGMAMDAADLDFVLRWAAPQRFHTKVVVGTPSYLRSRL